VTLEVKVTPNERYWTEVWSVEPLAMGYYETLFPVSQAILFSMLTTSTYNDTHWMDADFDAKYEEAAATVDDEKRQQLLDELQQRIWEEGGYLVWGFPQFILAAHPSITGIEPTTAPFNRRFELMSAG
jgi:peptide/nickel transport system substrate-binding protein